MHNYSVASHRHNVQTLLQLCRAKRACACSYAVFLDMGLAFKPKEMVKSGGVPFVFDKSKPSRIGLVRRPIDGVWPDSASKGTLLAQQALRFKVSSIAQPASLLHVQSKWGRNGSFAQ